MSFPLSVSWPGRARVPGVPALPYPVAATFQRPSPQRIPLVPSDDAALLPRPAVRPPKAGPRARPRQHPDAFPPLALVAVPRGCARHGLHRQGWTGGRLPVGFEVRTSDTNLTRRSRRPSDASTTAAWRPSTFNRMQIGPVEGMLVGTFRHGSEHMMLEECISATNRMCPATACCWWWAIPVHDRRHGMRWRAACRS